MMSEKKAFRARTVRLIVAVIICVFVIWLMSVLKCGMINPVY
jgi:hypothetical protein